VVFFKLAHPLLLLHLSAICNCSAEETGVRRETKAAAGIWRPKASDKLTWQWQLQGDIDTSFDVDMYDIDLFDAPASTIQALKDRGIVVVCYFSAGSYEGWRSDWKQFFPDITGETYTKDVAPFGGKMAGWDERWLDISRIDLLGPIMKSRMQLAKDKGCDAVEPDNVDAHTNGAETGLSLSAADQLAYNKWIAEQAHAVGLSVGLKNDLNQLNELVNYYDWALNEQCFEYNECSAYSTFTNADMAVFGVEYATNQLPSNFCPKAQDQGMSWLKKKLDLNVYRIGCEDVLSMPPAMSSAPTKAPVPFKICFSGETTVQVKNKGAMPMKKLEIGDEVLAAAGKYEQVYSFGHRHESVRAEFLQLLPSTLEISRDHMLLVRGRYVPASAVQVGDELESASGDVITVKAINTVVRTGVYAPFTSSGTIVVSNIKASIVGGWETPFTYQWIAHMSQSPHRILSRLGLSGAEEYTVDGMSTWIAGPHELSQWLIGQNWAVMTVVLVPAMSLGMLSMVLESVCQKIFL
jgi:endo-alpha-1,4-polygalactosaminidase (GH114 family)